VGSQAITTPHHLTTVPLARLGTDEVGGGLFLAVCARRVGGQRCFVGAGSGSFVGWSMAGGARLITSVTKASLQRHGYAVPSCTRQPAAARHCAAAVAAWATCRSFRFPSVSEPSTSTAARASGAHMDTLYRRAFRWWLIFLSSARAGLGSGSRSALFAPPGRAHTTVTSPPAPRLNVGYQLQAAARRLWRVGSVTTTATHRPASCSCVRCCCEP
jgi:hypothetical protein